MDSDTASPAPAQLPVAQQSSPIGIFDSGVGGLTVAGAIKRLLPHEPIVYVGDLARVPYGGRSPATVRRYSFEISRLLLERGAKAIVVACNSASAVAVPALRQEFTVPVLGVIDPGAAAAVASTRTGVVGVIGTRATIESGAYEEAIHRLNPEVRVVSAATPLLVPFIEEGWFDDAATEDVARRYLTPLLEAEIDTLVLGCTHYPLLKPLLRKVVGTNVSLVDSAMNCALALRDLLSAMKLAGPVTSREAPFQVALTDAPGNFLNVAAEALQLELGKVEAIGVPAG